MPYERAVIIHNPAAGWWRGGRARQIAQAGDVLRAFVPHVEAWPTSGPGTATELARKAERSGAGLVLACGGDGTINEILNGIAGTAAHLAVLPAGTANVLAREVGLPLDPVSAAKSIPSLEPRRVSLGRLMLRGPSPSSRYFLLMCGAGLDARIVYSLNRRLKLLLGVLAYWLAGFAEVRRRLHPFEIEVNGRRFQCTFALATQSSNYGGNLHIAPCACLLAGELDLVLFHAGSTFRYLPYLAGVLAGTLDKFSDVTFLKACHVELRPQKEKPVHVEVDGEYAGLLPATIDLVAGALTLLLPPAYGDRSSLARPPVTRHG